jgi:hypothetical protein
MQNKWQKRKAINLVCASGNEVVAQRPSPSLALKSQRYMRVLQKIGAGKVTTPEEQLAAMEQLPDDELEKLTAFAALVISDVVIEPQVSLTPKANQLHPSDIPTEDFWFIFMWVANGCAEIPVATTEGEVSVEALSNFPEGAGAVNEDSESSATVQ